MSFFKSFTETKFKNRKFTQQILNVKYSQSHDAWGDHPDLKFEINK